MMMVIIALTFMLILMTAMANNGDDINCSDKNESNINNNDDNSESDGTDDSVDDGKESQKDCKRKEIKKETTTSAEAITIKRALH